MKFRVVRDKGVELNGKHYAHGKIVEVAMPEEVEDLEPLAEGANKAQTERYEKRKAEQLAAKTAREKEVQRIQDLIDGKGGQALEPKDDEAEDAVEVTPDAKPAKKKKAGGK